MPLPSQKAKTLKEAVGGDRSYFDSLTAAGVKWGFSSMATTVLAKLVLEGRVSLDSPGLVAMENTIGKLIFNAGSGNW